VSGLGLPDHVIGHGLAQDPIHHRQVLPVVVSLEQGVALKTNKTSFIWSVMLRMIKRRILNDN
jgi:hypothetical protein